MNERLWMVRAGERAYLIDDFLNQSIISIGWEELGDLQKNQNIKASLQAQYPNKSDGWINMSSSQVLKFRDDISKGTRVLTYHPSERVYWLGTVVSDYEFNPESNYDHAHIRKVRWDAEVKRDLLSTNTKNSLGAISTIFQLSTEASAEILSRINQTDLQPVAPVEDSVEENIFEDVEDKAREFIKDRIVNLDWKDMQELVAGILRAMGYKTMISPSGPDRGKDIIASPDGLGLEDPKIVVEVKHRKNSTMGAPEIRSLLGGLRPNDKSLYVSTGGFSKEARYEAERANNSLTLVDLDLLTDLILQNYDQFDSESRTLLPLKKLYWPV